MAAVCIPIGDHVNGIRAYIEHALRLRGEHQHLARLDAAHLCPGLQEKVIDAKAHVDEADRTIATARAAAVQLLADIDAGLYAQNVASRSNPPPADFDAQVHANDPSSDPDNPNSGFDQLVGVRTILKKARDSMCAATITLDGGGAYTLHPDVIDALRRTVHLPIAIYARLSKCNALPYVQGAQLQRHPFQQRCSSKRKAEAMAVYEHSEDTVRDHVLDALMDAINTPSGIMPFPGERVRTFVDVDEARLPTADVNVRVQKALKKLDGVIKAKSTAKKVVKKPKTTPPPALRFDIGHKFEAVCPRLRYEVMRLALSLGRSISNQGVDLNEWTVTEVQALRCTIDDFPRTIPVTPNVMHELVALLSPGGRLHEVYALNAGPLHASMNDVFTACFPAGLGGVQMLTRVAARRLLKAARYNETSMRLEAADAAATSAERDAPDPDADATDDAIGELLLLHGGADDLSLSDEDEADADE